MDRGAWRAAVHGVTKSRTGLKQLSMHAPVSYFCNKTANLAALNNRYFISLVDSGLVVQFFWPGLTQLTSPGFAHGSMVSWQAS